MRVGAVIIGDELLSGKRQDRHMAFLVEALSARGMELSFVHFVGDDPELLTQTFVSTMASRSVVLSFGGIGATPDDRTRQCLAMAAGATLERHPEAVGILERRFGAEAYPHRIRMTEFPQGATLIPNPVNEIPGFSYAHHHCVPGFPNMAWPMIEWVLDTLYPHLHHAAPQIERRVLIENTPESELIPVMEAIIVAYPALRVSSLPSGKPGCREVELGLRGAAPEVAEAMEALMHALSAQGVAWKALV